MLTSFILLGIVAFLYYLDVRKDSVIDIRSEMLKVLYSIRENKDYKTDKFHVRISDPTGFIAPSFTQYTDRFELVACANPHHQDQVYVITAPISLAHEYLQDISKKILIGYLLLFIPFTLFGYILSRLALIPWKNAYESLVYFNQDIIHDLKTPITTIRINGELIEKQEKPLQRVVNATKFLEELYLNLESYLTTGQHLKHEPFELKSLIEQKVILYKSLYTQARFEINLADCSIKTDKIAFIRILDNIVANAIKHGVKEPVVSIKIKNKQLFIEDNGAGIQNPEKIFKRYYCEKPYIKGFGLGLNIVKRLSEELHIPIEITSSQEGTIFKLNLAKIVIHDLTKKIGE